MAYRSEVETRLVAWREAAGGLAGALEQGIEGDWRSPRAAYDAAFVRMFTPPKGVTFAQTELGPVPAIHAKPSAPTEGRTVLYLHGGGYASGSAAGYRALAGHLALILEAEVFVPDYRLAPHHQFPVPIEDSFAAYSALLDRGVAPDRVVLGGDSAGGAIVLTLLRWAQERGIASPAGGFAYSPWADLSHSGLSIRQNAARDPFVELPFLEALATTFLGEVPATHPDASPVFATFGALPPVLIQVGALEIMLSDAVRVSERLAMGGTRVSLQIVPEMFHVFPLFADLLPEADAALVETATFAAAAFGDA